MLKNKFTFLVLFLLGLIGSYRLMRPGYFSMQDDMHIFRLQQLDKCVHDGQFPCRYVPDGGLGYGYPLFNFYSPFPYAVAEGFHLVGVSYIDSVKLVFIITSFIRPVGIFLLSSLFFGVEGGLVSAIIFSLAPYQAVNSYVRGAIAENLALALIPFVFWAAVRRRYFLLSLFLAALALTHNLTLLYTFPLFILFSLVFLRHDFLNLLKFTLIGLGMASFFILPAFFEKQLTTVDTMTQGYFYFVNHFATLRQLFLNHNDWGYGASLWGPKDDMSFQVGYLQWLLPLIVAFFAFGKKFKHKLLIFSFLLVGFFALFLTHNQSTFIWTHLPLMPFYQFPWRFIALAIFSFSLICGAIFQFKFFKKISIPFILVTLIVEMILNFSFFKEDIWYSKLTDQQKLSGANLIAQSGAGLKDYWPKYGANFPTTYSSQKPEILAGSVKVLSFSKNSKGATGKFEVSSDSAVINLPVVYFPDFTLNVDSQAMPYLIDHDLGLVTIALPTGVHQIDLSFTNTTLRFLANTISLTSLVIFGLFYIYRGHQT